MSQEIRDVLKNFPELAGQKTMHIVSCTNKTKEIHDENLAHIKAGRTGFWKIAKKRKVAIKKGDIVVVVMSQIGNAYPKDIYCGTIRADVVAGTGEPVVLSVNYVYRKKSVTQIDKALGIKYFLGTNTPQGNTVRSIPGSETWVEKTIDNKEHLSMLRKIQDDTALSDTQKTVQIQARIGQGKFRKQVVKKWRSRCAVTGLSIERLLVASHIVPWIDCKTGSDRINPLNALLLTPNIDCLFDRKALHLISFSSEGHMLYKKDITVKEKKAIQQIVPRHSSSIWEGRSFKSTELTALRKFLAEHRKGSVWLPKKDLDTVHFHTAKDD